jgi:polyphosphate glucokinase
MPMTAAKKTAFGIDIGGTGIKGAPVDLKTGELTAERHRILTPTPSTPERVADVVAEILEHFKWTGPVGITFPAVVAHGVTRTAANVDQSWVDADADAIFEKRLGVPAHVVNDADAAGLAEARFGAAKDQDGLVIVITLGTGIGSALLLDGTLVPNTELGHLELAGFDAETRASDAAREREGLDWKKWATKRLRPYFRHVEDLFWPDLFVVGGGVSKKADKWMPYLKIRTPMVPAALKNEAGIVGAALLVTELGGD